MVVGVGVRRAPRRRRIGDFGGDVETRVVGLHRHCEAERVGLAGERVARVHACGPLLQDAIELHRRLPVGVLDVERAAERDLDARRAVFAIAVAAEPREPALRRREIPDRLVRLRLLRVVRGLRVVRRAAATTACRGAQENHAQCTFHVRLDIGPRSLPTTPMRWSTLSSSIIGTIDADSAMRTSHSVPLSE